MGRKRYTPEQIISMLCEAEVLHNQDSKMNEICRKRGISAQTFCRWRKEYGGMSVDQAKRLKELEKEKSPEVHGKMDMPSHLSGSSEMSC